MTRLKAVILDIDGTLLDSNEAHARAFIEAAAELGVAADFNEVRRRIGMGSDKLIPEVFGVEKESPLGKQIDEGKSEIFRDRFLPVLVPTPGARALLARMRADGLKLVVATSAKGEELAGLLGRAGVADLVEECTSASDVEGSKPEPDVVHAALEQAGVSAGEALMLGDTPYDVEAATRAGVRIVAVRSGGWEGDDLRGAVAVYDHPADLLARYAESPIVQDA